MNAFAHMARWSSAQTQKWNGILGVEIMRRVIIIERETQTEAKRSIWWVTRLMDKWFDINDIITMSYLLINYNQMAS